MAPGAMTWALSNPVAVRQTAETAIVATGGLAGYDGMPSPTSVGGAVFRGTTRGFAGGGSGVTFASTDPMVATVFATQKRNLGTPIIEIVKMADLAHVPRLPSISPSLARIEAEIIFDISPTDFSKLATQVPLDDAVRALNRMGISVPSNVPLSDLSSVLRELEKLNQNQIDDFLRVIAQ